MIDPKVGEDTQFKPGESGNPNGRPKGTKNFSTRVKELLSGISDDKEWTSPIAAEKIKIVFSKDKEGNYKYPPEIRNKVMNDILERAEGKIKDVVELTGENGNPIENHITIEFINAKNSVSKKT